MKNKKLKVALLTGGKDPHYALGLLEAISSRDLMVDFIGNDHMTNDQRVNQDNIRYFNIRGDQSPDARLPKKITRVLKYYIRLIYYVLRSDADIFHILWFNKFLFLDQTSRIILSRLIGKKLVHTAHNVNMAERDGQDNALNRISLKFMYRRLDYIFVHTRKMKQQLVGDFGVSGDRVSVIPFGANNVIPQTGLTREGAREKLGVGRNENVILFFGNIAPYKGLHMLPQTLLLLKERNIDFRVVIAGSVKNCQDYWDGVVKELSRAGFTERTLIRNEYIPDEEVEVYMKSADVFLLPYTHIFQSGALFLAYSFGLPVIAADVGSLCEDIVEGETGFVFKAEDTYDLSEKIAQFFNSTMYLNTQQTRKKILKHLYDKHSWSNIGKITSDVYLKIV